MLAKCNIFFTIFNIFWSNHSLYLVLSVGGKKAREVVLNFLLDACFHDDLSITEAIAIVKAIFAENAKKFYKIDASSIYSDVEPQSLSNPFKKEDLNGPLTDVTAVRIIWDGKETWTRMDKTSYCSTTTINVASLVLQDIHASLHSFNILVEQVSFHFLQLIPNLYCISFFVACLLIRGDLVPEI
uniref:Uncharacterized protein n=1 Tax=Solanum lycopersicum TaxID=4081 RepID=K4AVL2_SOLLC